MYVRGSYKLIDLIPHEKKSAMEITNSRDAGASKNFMKKIICLEWSNMPYKHDIVLFTKKFRTLDSLGLFQGFFIPSLNGTHEHGLDFSAKKGSRPQCTGGILSPFSILNFVGLKQIHQQILAGVGSDLVTLSVGESDKV